MSTTSIVNSNGFKAFATFAESPFVAHESIGNLAINIVRKHRAHILWVTPVVLTASLVVGAWTVICGVVSLFAAAFFDIYSLCQKSGSEERERAFGITGIFILTGSWGIIMGFPAAIACTFAFVERAHSLRV